MKNLKTDFRNLKTTYFNEYQTKIIEKNRKKDISKLTRYDTSLLKFIDLYLSKDISDLSTACNKGCNLNIQDYEKEFKYIITKDTKGEYFLDVVYLDTALYRGISLGYDITSLYMMNYKNMILLGNVYSNRHFKYDYLIVIDKNGNKDEFSSISEGEIIITDDGITYTYDTCYKNEDGNAIRTKALRYPFTSDVKVISSEGTNYEWCNV